MIFISGCKISQMTKLCQIFYDIFLSTCWPFLILILIMDKMLVKKYFCPYMLPRFFVESRKVAKNGSFVSILTIFCTHSYYFTQWHTELTKIRYREINFLGLRQFTIFRALNIVY